MVVNHIHDHCNAALVRLVHEGTEPVRSTVLLVNCEDVSWVVSPRSISLEFSGGHDFNRVDPKGLQIIEFRLDRSKRAARLRQRLDDHKCADVQFVDHHLIPCRGCVGSVGISRIARSDQAGSPTDLECAAVRINVRQYDSRSGVRNQVIVLLPHCRPGLIRAPIAIPFGVETGTRFPIIKISLDLHVRSKRRPHAERHAAIVRSSSHVRSR